MGKIKRLASGVFRRSDGEIVVIATAWGFPGKRERVLPKETELYEAIKTRKDLLAELKKPEVTRSSLTLHNFVELFRNKKGKHAQTSIVADIDRDLGHVAIPQLEEAWTLFIERQAHRNRMVWRRVGKERKLIDTGKPLSAATLKGYKRYFKAICRFAMSIDVPKEIRLSKESDPSAGLKVGKAKPRRRPIQESERKLIFETSLRLYPWFVPAIRFSSTMPIRPGDLCELKTDAIDELHGQIPYLPQKTRLTETMAYPLILPNMRQFILGRIGDEECPFIFYAEDKTGRRVQMNYHRLDSAWWVICREAGLRNLRFYDLRHDAVNYCLSLGFSTRDVMAFAGWNSAEMVDDYDTRDRVRLAERAKKILASVELDKYTVNATVNARGANAVKIRQ